MFFGLACNSVPENWHICVNKGLTYLKKDDGHMIFELIEKGFAQFRPVALG